MYHLIQRRKVTILALFVTTCLVYTFGAGPLFKFFHVLFQCLSEFNYKISRNADDVKIYIWTSRDRVEYKIVDIGDKELLLSAGFNSSYPIKITIHGFSDKGITSWTDTLRKEYFSVGKYNIFTVDWEPLAQSPWYNIACKNTRIVGKKTAKFVEWLVTNMDTDYDKIHVLGSSLGAQAAGYVGFFTGGAIARITGLDPSGPLFYSVTNEDRLDKTDAQFVDIYHTAGYWVGSTRPDGHVDVWPNGGLAPQPGCRGKESLDLSCSHFKAWRMFAESIAATRKGNNALPFVGTKCDNYQKFLSGGCCDQHSQFSQLGDPINTTVRGHYFLLTGSQMYRMALPNINSSLCNISQ